MPGGAGPGGGIAELEQEQPPGAVRLDADHLLLQHRWHQGLHDPARPADPQTLVALGQLAEHRMHRIEAGRVVVDAEGRGEVAE